MYTLEVALMSGPVSKKYDGKKVARVIEISGRNTLEDLHDVTFDAFDREEQHLWEFLVGGTHRHDKKNRRYGPAEHGDGQDATETTLDDLKLKVGTAFGYIFDFGDDWEHSIYVKGITDTTGRQPRPKIVERIGKSPPQYPESW